MTVFTQSSYSGPLQFTGHPYHHHLPQHLGEAGSLPSRRTSGLEGANASYPPKGHWLLRRDFRCLSIPRRSALQALRETILEVMPEAEQ